MTRSAGDDPGALPPHTLVVPAPAKVNLLLRVLATREDGFHDLETLVVPIGLEDRLHVHAFADPGVFRSLSLSLELEGEPEAVAGVPLDESNLVLRAASALAAAAGGVRGFAEFVLQKRVPAAAGLGGGSGDAAAALLALNDLWGTRLPDERLREVGASVGSDVPALLVGSAAIARGRGERVEPASVPGLRMVLVPFSFGVSTADAFRWWDEDGSVTGAEPAAALAAFRAGAAAPPGGGPTNDLEAPVAARHPAIAVVRDLLLEGGAAAALMTGSGPTMVGILPKGRRGIDQGARTAIEQISGRAVIETSSRST